MKSAYDNKVSTMIMRLVAMYAVTAVVAIGIVIAVVASAKDSTDMSSGKACNGTANTTSVASVRVRRQATGTEASTTEEPRTTHPSSMASCCPQEWMQFNGSCYFFQREEINFADAEALCVSLGGHLVHVNNEEEHLFLKRTVMDRYGYDHWIGCSDIETEGTWRWTDMDTSSDYTNFGSGEPNDGRAGNCCLMYQYIDYLWADASCIQVKAPICEITRNM